MQSVLGTSAAAGFQLDLGEFLKAASLRLPLALTCENGVRP